MILLIILFVLVCILLAFMVVITPSSEGGMAAAFGGMGSESFFGTKAHQHINKFTVFLAAAFLVLAVAINRVNTGRAVGGGTGLQKRMERLPAPPSGAPVPPLPPAPPAPPK